MYPARARNRIEASLKPSKLNMRLVRHVKLYKTKGHLLNMAGFLCLYISGAYIITQKNEISSFSFRKFNLGN
ncbi:MAG TPA: hypothetical protein DCR43_00200 [Bacteroidales bacterium]|nr:hypothetical protein [Bacteroidales bacterium]